MKNWSREKKLSYVLYFTGFLLLIGFSTVVFWASVLASLDPFDRAMFLTTLESRVGLMLLMGGVTAAVMSATFHHFFGRYVHAPLQFAEQVRIILSANRGHRLDPGHGAREMRMVAEAVNALAEQHDALHRDVEEKVRQARATVEEEKNRLAALMSELTQSVLVCNLDGRILLYNQQARSLLGAEGSGAVGLGRSVFGLFDRGLIAHALDSIEHQVKAGDERPAGGFVTTTAQGALVRAQVAPVVESGKQRLGGYVLMLDDVTQTVEVETRRDQLLQGLTEGSRSSIGNIRAAVETLIDYGDMAPEQRERFLGVIRDEAAQLGARLDDTERRYADSLKVRWPLEEMRGLDLIAALQRRISAESSLPSKCESIDEQLWVKVDSFSLVHGLCHFAHRLEDEFDIREIRLRLQGEGAFAHLDLIWSGAIVSTETVLAWELDAMGGASGSLSLRDIVDRHGGELWYKVEKAAHRAYLRVLVPLASPGKGRLAAPPVESRPEFYDFDLFRLTDENRHLDDRRLVDLTFTVFDTETTGLRPHQGDEIIQFGAMRIVNNRLLRGEVFDQLVDPQRKLSAEASKITGITSEMLRGQPVILDVLPRFHGFCADTVLVAHNAAFDLRFLQLKEQDTGLVFDMPVLDTLLLSAVIHPNQDSHRLEAIAERLGVNVIGRHTALGDALVTGEVFMRMIPLLAEKGIHTLGEAREAARQTYYARIEY